MIRFKPNDAAPAKPAQAPVAKAAPDADLLDGVAEDVAKAPKKTIRNRKNDPKSESKL